MTFYADTVVKFDKCVIKVALVIQRSPIYVHFVLLLKFLQKTPPEYFMSMFLTISY